MALINLLPSSKKHSKTTKVSKSNSVKISFKASKKILLIPTAILLLLLLGWSALFIQVKGREKTLSLLNKELMDFKSSNKKTEYLSNKKSELSDKLAFYKKISGGEISWSKLLSFINTAEPDQVWLTGIYIETKPNKALVIKGSATSMIESRIIVSISRFANRLKSYSYFSKNFDEIKLGPLSLEKKGGLSIMNFSLFCRLK
jgi:hypothetical protein